MKLLLTSSGITNATIRNALVELLGKPIEESSALFVPTGIYPFRDGFRSGYRATIGQLGGPMAALGWKSMGVLELTALPSIDPEAWQPTVRETDALLIWGGDPVYLAHWLRESGLAALLPSLTETVYVGTSAGAIAAADTFVESYSNPPKRAGEVLKTEDAVVETPDGDIPVKYVTARGIGLIDFTIIPHLEVPNHEDAWMTNAQNWASRMPGPTYAIDDNSAIRVVDGAVEVVSEGHWKLFDS
jgi:dipeptidase E